MFRTTATLIALSLSPTALAQSFQPIVNESTKLCLDLDGVDGAAGRKAKVSDCQVGPDQAWSLVAKSLFNAAQEQCITPSGLAGPCVNGGIERVPVTADTFRLRDVGSNRCVELAGVGATRKNATLTLGPCTNDPDQVWRNGPATPHVAMFDAPNYGGKRVVITTGDADVVAHLGGRTLGSSQSANAVVAAYSAAQYGGTCVIAPVRVADIPAMGFGVGSVNFGACPSPVPPARALPVVQETPLPTSAVLFQHGLDVGFTQTITEDTSDINGLVWGLSALRITGGPVAVWEGEHFTGRCRTFTGEVGWVGDDFNDVAHSIQLDTVCPGDTVTSLYMHSFDSVSITVTSNTTDLYPIGYGDVVSAARVWGGPVALYEHPDYQGACLTLTGDVPWMADWNDIFNSVKVGLGCP